MVETIYCGDKLLAIIMNHDFSQLGAKFVTPHELSQQVAFIRHDTGWLIEPHIHNPVAREVLYTQEVLLIKKGVLRVDFYDDNQKYHDNRVLHEGDVIVLVSGGHGFEVIESVEIVEVKQGPFSGDNDKTRFVKKDEG